MDKASIETSAFFRYPAKRINAMKYQTSKLQKLSFSNLQKKKKKNVKRRI
jgi:hypothetical protein